MSAGNKKSSQTVFAGSFPTMEENEGREFYKIEALCEQREKISNKNKDSREITGDIVNELEKSGHWLRWTKTFGNNKYFDRLYYKTDYSSMFGSTYLDLKDGQVHYVVLPPVGRKNTELVMGTYQKAKAEVIKAIDELKD